MIDTKKYFGIVFGTRLFDVIKIDNDLYINENYYGRIHKIGDNHHWDKQSYNFLPIENTPKFYTNLKNIENREELIKANKELLVTIKKKDIIN